MENPIKYRVKLRSPAERETIIRAAIEETPDKRDFYEFRGQQTKLPFIRTGEDNLLYRMENFRTYIEQREYVVRESKQQNYFLLGEENESVQQLQHEILARLARRGRADSVTPVIDVLRTQGQREPLLITYRGVVVNGNRRLAGMRELLADNAFQFENFRYVDCLVLPKDATPDEILDIEAALQASPETRLDYDWISDCLLIQKLLLGRTVDQVASRLNRKDTEIKNSIAALSEGNLYLRDWVKAEGEYSRIVEAEQLFKDLPSLLQGKEAPLAEASRMIAWNLFENKGKLKERLYAFNPAVGKHAKDVLDRLSQNLNIKLKNDDVEDDGTFAIDIETGQGPVSYAPLVDAFRDQDKKEEAVDSLIEICRGVVEAERGKKTGSAALRAIRTAHARLMEVDLGAADRASYSEIDGQLDQVVGRAEGLKALLAKLRASEDKP